MYASIGDKIQQEITSNVDNVFIFNLFIFNLTVFFHRNLVHIYQIQKVPVHYHGLVNKHI
jgi:hypothetical protein